MPLKEDGEQGVWREVLDYVIFFFGDRVRLMERDYVVILAER
jgi:hypothetical protein